MHLGNGAITPECGLVALSVAAVGVGTALVAARATGIRRDRAVTAAALGAGVFAAQLFNLPILPFSSVHLVGGVLLAWTLSPALAVLLMSGILLLQAVLLGDGGLLSLGANIINMGLVPAAAVVMARRAGKSLTARHPNLALAGAAFFSVVAAAGLILLEVAWGRSSDQLAGFEVFASRLLAWHALAGIVEAGLTVAIVAALARLAERDARDFALSPRAAALVGAVSLAVAVLSLPMFGLASDRPDSYEAALSTADQSGLAIGRIESDGALVGAAATAQAWQDRATAALPPSGAPLLIFSTLLAGALGGICVLAAAGHAVRPNLEHVG